MNDRHETGAFKRSLGEHAYRHPDQLHQVDDRALARRHRLPGDRRLRPRHGARASLPPTANLHEPDPELDLDYIPLTAREKRTDVVLSVGSGFGGFQSAMVLARPERSTA